MKKVNLVASNTRDFVLNRTPTGCRLLYVIGQLGLGGAERQLYYLLSNLDRRYQPCLAVWNFDPHEKYYRDIDALKIPVYGFPAKWSSIAKLWALRRVARTLDPEVVHSYTFFTNFAADFAACGTGALAIGSVRSEVARSIRASGKLRGLLNSRRPSCHISNSAVCVADARKNSSLFVPKRHIVVRNGVDLYGFQNSADSFETSTYVASVGSLLPVKRWDRLLRAIQKVITVGFKDVRFRLAGDGRLRSDLEQMARDLGVAHNVEFLGAVHDIPAFLQGAKFLVHTSASEGCPNAVMEAMAAGRTVAATDVGDIPHLVEDGKTGFVIRQDDEEALANRIVTLLTDVDLCRQMGMNARAKAEQEFGLASFVKRTLDAYRNAGWKDENDSQTLHEAK